MSRVYRYEEMVDLPLPTPETFAVELDFVRQTLGGLCLEGHVSGAFMYGSATTEPSPGSDIDLLIATPAITPAAKMGIRAMSRTVYNRSGIPIDVSCSTESDLMSGNPPPFYREHVVGWFKQLAACFPQNVIGRNPIDIIRPAKTDLIADTSAFLGARKHMFEMTFMKGRYSYSEGLLEEIWNFPHLAGRESLGVLQFYGHIPPDSLTDARKGTIAQAVAHIFGRDDPAIAELYRALESSRDLYPSLVYEARTEHVTREEYMQLIAETVAADLPRVISLAHKMHTAYQHHAAS